ncbi:F-box/LRR-repeat protein 14 [Linum perenne]
MGGICSRKRDQRVLDDGIASRVCGRYGKSGSSKWLRNSSFGGHVLADSQTGGNSPSLMELCIHKICKDIERYKSLSILPRDISQQIFNELVLTHCLNEDSLPAFVDCALQDVHLGDCPGVKDSWMDVISSQETSLLSLDISDSEITDAGLACLKDCLDLQALTLNYCEYITEHGLKHISGLTNLTSLSFKRSKAITAEGMSAFSNLVNLEKLDLERCSQIHGGLFHLKGLTNLKELQISNCSITDFGVSLLRGLQKIVILNLEGCNVSTACLDSLAALVNLAYLNLSRCGLSDEGCEKLSVFFLSKKLNYFGLEKPAELKKLRVLSLAFNNITDAILAHLKGLKYLESLNLDSCKIGDEGLANLSGLPLKSLELSDTEVGSSGLRHLSGLTQLESLNLSFTLVTDSGLRRLSGVTSLRSLNLDARQITDAGLAALTSLTELAHLDLFGARISDTGTNCLRYFKNLQSLEICGGGITDAGVKNIKDLSRLTVLNLSQNSNLTDKTLEMISGLEELVSLNVSNSLISNKGLQHLKPLKNLRSLTLESCKVTAAEIRKLQLTELPGLVSFRPE